MEDFIEVEIGGNKVKFGFLGRAFRLKVAEKIRADRKLAFRDAVKELPNNPTSAASVVGVAVDTYMTGMIVEDHLINEWLSTPDGYFFSFQQSLLKASPDLAEKAVELHDRLSTEDYAALRKYWGRSIDGSRYDDIEKSVEVYFQRAAVEYYGADGNVIKAFADWLEAGRPGLQPDGAVREEEEVVAAEVKEEPEVVAEESE